MSLDEQGRQELRAIFQVELGEHCQALTHAFLALEKEPDATEERQLLGEAFRGMHLAGFATVFAGVLLMSWEHARMSRED